MKFRISPIAAMLGSVAVLTGTAWADTCETENLPKALNASIRTITSPEQFQQAVVEIDGHVTSCPGHPWINMLGALMDMRIYDAVVSSNSNVVSQDAVNYLQRAFTRSDAFISVPAAMRQDQLAIPTDAGVGQLTYSAALENRASIIRTLMKLAGSGQVHPYISAQTPPTCSGWLIQDTQTIGYATKTEADLVFLPFLNAAAKACRNTDSTGDRLPLAIKAETFASLVKDEVITEPEKIRDTLLKARDARDAYLADREFDFFYSKYDSASLDDQLRRHGVDPRAGLLARELWITPEHIGTEKMIFTLAMALSEEWAAISASVKAEELTMASGATRFTTFINAIVKEGREAGLEDKTRGSLRLALRDMQESRVRAPAMKGLDLPPQWLYDMLTKTSAAPVAKD